MTYQKALDEIKNMLNDMTQNENDSFKYHYYIKLGTIDLLQELVNEKIEFQSRKDYLKVGSEWECVAKSLAPISARYIDPILDKHTIAIQKSWVLTVLEIEKDYVKLQYENTKCFLSQDQFLLCFKPLKEGE